MLLSVYYISKSRHQNKRRDSAYKRNYMNNINARDGEYQTHEVVHHKINCQISSDLIAYYVMSVHTNEYKKDNMLYLQYTGRGGNSTPVFNDYVCGGHICKSF